jgi:hypothetical protein
VNTQEALARAAAPRRLAWPVPVEGNREARWTVARDRRPVGAERIVGVGGVERILEDGEVADATKREGSTADSLEVGEGRH